MTRTRGNEAMWPGAQSGSKGKPLREIGLEQPGQSALLLNSSSEWIFCLCRLAMLPVRYRNVDARRLNFWDICNRKAHDFGSAVRTHSKMFNRTSFGNRASVELAVEHVSSLSLTVAQSCNSSVSVSLEKLWVFPLLVVILLYVILVMV